MLGDKMLISLGVEDLGVSVIFGVPDSIGLGVTGIVTLGVLGKFSLWVASKVVF